MYNYSALVGRPSRLLTRFVVCVQLNGANHRADVSLFSAIPEGPAADKTYGACVSDTDLPPPSLRCVFPAGHWHIVRTMYPSEFEI